MVIYNYGATRSSQLPQIQVVAGFNVDPKQGLTDSQVVTVWGLFYVRS